VPPLHLWPREWLWRSDEVVSGLKLFGILANIGLCEVPLIPASAGVARLKVGGVGPGEAWQCACSCRLWVADGVSAAPATGSPQL
jgi:hypothetical protein